MATIHFRDDRMSPPLTSLAMRDNVSPRRTTRVDPAPVAALGAYEGDDEGVEGCCGAAPSSADDACGEREISPLRVESPLTGAATGA
jgi:hypothetical protein